MYREAGSLLAGDLLPICNRPAPHLFDRIDAGGLNSLPTRGPVPMAVVSAIDHSSRIMLFVPPLNAIVASLVLWVTVKATRQDLRLSLIRFESKPDSGRGASRAGRPEGSPIEPKHLFHRGKF